MPSGIVHDRITIWLLPWVGGITYYTTRSSELTLILACGYLFSAMMFGPDLDICSLQYKRWGIIRGIWLPYRRCLPHRSLFSHGLIIGTCIRLLYLFSIIALISTLGVAIAQLCFGFAWNWQDFVRDWLDLLMSKYHKETAAVLIGLEIGAISHSISDWIYSYRKQRLKNKLSQAKTQPKRLRQARVYQKKK